MEFTKGNVYKRSEIHSIYGGQQQGGISTPIKCPIIFIFSGDIGSNYGYSDGWKADGLFDYTGEGQVGPMTFVRGNSAIRDHVKNGKSIYLFESLNKGFVKFVDEMVCVGYHDDIAPDRNGDQRMIIVFELLPLTNIETKEEILNVYPQNNSLEDLRKKAVEASRENAPRSERKSNVMARIQAIRDYALRRANGICEACGAEAPFITKSGDPFLEVHHTKRLSDGGPDHPERVAAICPNCHRHAHYAVDALEFNKSIEAIICQKEVGIKSQIY